MSSYRKGLMAQASRCPEFDNDTRDKEQIEMLANRYCDISDELEACHDSQRASELKRMKGDYGAALVLKFWTRVKDLYDGTKAVSEEEYSYFVATVLERVDYACQYRAWRGEGAKHSAQACINQAISTEILNIIGRANWSKNKANTPFAKASLDAPVGGDDDGAILSDTLGEEDAQGSSFVSDVVQGAADAGKVVEAIALDVISSCDCVKQEKKRETCVAEDGEETQATKVVWSFWPRRCVQALKELPPSYQQKFLSKYKVNPSALKACIAKIKSSPSSKLYKYVESAQEFARSEFADAL